MQEKWRRTIQLLGESSVEKLKNAHVAIFGLGGVGSFTTEALARVGIGELTLVDADEIEWSNINRQLYALHSTVGKDKVILAKERILDINPDCIVHIEKKFYLPEDGNAFFKDTTFDYIVDAIDTVTAKIDLVVRAKEKHIPIISSMGTGNKIHPERFEIADIYETSVCPICRVMRRELRQRDIPNLLVVYSKEVPQKTDEGRTPASISFTPPVAGFLLASKVVQDIIE